MPNLNIPVDADLLVQINVESAKLGLSQKDWVITKLTEAVSGRLRHNGDEEVKLPSVPFYGRGLATAVDSAVEKVSKEDHPCPECGESMVHNKILKRWVCECGYQGKVERNG